MSQSVFKKKRINGRVLINFSVTMPKSKIKGFKKLKQNHINIYRFKVRHHLWSGCIRWCTTIEQQQHWSTNLRCCRMRRSVQEIMFYWVS